MFKTGFFSDDTLTKKLPKIRKETMIIDTIQELLSNFGIWSPLLPVSMLKEAYCIKAYPTLREKQNLAECFSMTFKQVNN